MQLLIASKTILGGVSNRTHLQELRIIANLRIRERAINHAHKCVREANLNNFTQHS